tara:strand:- start:642 stop:1871 length:1230 start_codon:yes stop_codon:yes gene_type:complete
MIKTTYDIAILGGGMVGLSIANQLIERKIAKKIIIIDKEEKLGSHGSGRNSGVLHSGVYYNPGSLKATVCVAGARRLKEWIQDRNLPINCCGKVIIPQKEHLDSQLDLLKRRGDSNGATVHIIDNYQLKELIPEARSSSGRALWSPNTVVVKPLTVIKTLQSELEQKGVEIYTNQKDYEFNIELKELKLQDGNTISYGHLINCTGLQADRIAHKFGVGNSYKLLPFKGLYWQLNSKCPFIIKRNLYPVPDLNIPFLGVHFTPSADQIPTVSIGPTASPALGRYNYRGLEAFEPIMSLQNLSLLANQYLFDKGGFRRYVHEQAFLSLPVFLIKAAQELIPSIKPEYIEMSSKVGIRSQLFNKVTRKLEDDFLCLPGPDSTHVLNAISPAFTASFSLADLIIDQSGINKIT